MTCIGSMASALSNSSSATSVADWEKSEKLTPSGVTVVPTGWADPASTANMAGWLVVGGWWIVAVEKGTPRNSARQFSNNLHRDRARAGQVMGEPIGPFDGQHAVFHADFLEPEIVGRGTIEAVEIRVIERETSAAIFVDERESGNADVGGIVPEAFCEDEHKRRLARPVI